MHRKELIRIIENSKMIRKDTRKKMVRLVDELDTDVSFERAWEKVSADLTAKQKRTVIDSFKKLNVNPIPLNYKKLDSMPSLFPLLEKLDEEGDEMFLR